MTDRDLLISIRTGREQDQLLADPEVDTLARAGIHRGIVSWLEANCRGMQTTRHLSPGANYLQLPRGRRTGWHQPVCDAGPENPARTTLPGRCTPRRPVMLESYI